MKIYPMLESLPQLNISWIMTLFKDEGIYLPTIFSAQICECFSCFQRVIYFPFQEKKKSLRLLYIDSGHVLITLLSVFL